MGDRKYKIGVIDNEFWIRQSIIQKIRRTDYEVVYDTEDGQQLLKYLREEEGRNLDVVIVDIVMPGMDGLTLIHKIKEIHPDMVCIILSGHRDFSYMQKAIRMSVDDYLLKPIDPSALSDTLDKVLEKLEQRDSQRVEACVEQLSDYVFQKGNGMLDNEAIRTIQEAFPDGFYLVMCLYGNWDSIGNWFGVYQKNPWYFIYPGTPNLMITLNRKSHIYKMPLETEAADPGSCPTTTVYRSHVLEGVERISAAIEEGLREIRRNLTLEKCSFMIQGTEQEETERVRRWKETADVNLELLEKFVQDKKCGKIYEKAEEVIKEERIPQFLMEGFVGKVFFILCKNTGQPYEEYIGCSFQDCDDRGSFIREVKQTLTQLMEPVSREDSGVSSKDTVEKIVRDIGLNYASPMTLKEVADKYFINRSHLARVFKQTMGMTFNEYLTSVRVEKACGLLVGQQKSVTETAFLVGYEDNRYFSQVFLKVMGESPSKYRQRYMGNRE